MGRATLENQLQYDVTNQLTVLITVTGSPRYDLTAGRQPSAPGQSKPRANCDKLKPSAAALVRGLP
jgi:hypothetical protein